MKAFLALILLSLSVTAQAQVCSFLFPSKAAQKIAKQRMLPEVSAKDENLLAQLQTAKLRLARQKNERLSVFKKRLKKDASAKSLPTTKTGSDIQFRDAFERIHKLFNPQNAEQIFDLMQEVELELITRTLTQKISPGEAWEQMLQNWESAHGFKAARKLEGVLTASQWREMLRHGGLPRDNDLRDYFHLQSGFLRHGYSSHRLQWNLIMRDMHHHPQYYKSLQDNPQASRLFRYLGDESLRRKLDWSLTGFEGYREFRDRLPFPGSRTLWDLLFEGDGFQHDFHNPIFIQNMIMSEGNIFWPALYNVIY